MSHDQRTNRTPSQDAQGRWYELLSPTQVLTNDDAVDDGEQSIQVCVFCRHCYDVYSLNFLL